MSARDRPPSAAARAVSARECIGGARERAPGEREGSSFRVRGARHRTLTPPACECDRQWACAAPRGRKTAGPQTRSAERAAGATALSVSQAGRSRWRGTNGGRAMAQPTQAPGRRNCERARRRRRSCVADACPGRGDCAETAGLAPLGPGQTKGGANGAGAAMRARLTKLRTPLRTRPCAPAHWALCIRGRLSAVAPLSGSLYSASTDGVTGWH